MQSVLSPPARVHMPAVGSTAAAGVRNAELRRANKVEAVFDLYEFMLKGDRSADRLVQAGDVIHVHPVGMQVAFVGSVNQPAIFELKPGETVADVLRMSGGFSAVADRTRLAVERLDERSRLRVAQLAMPQSLGSVLGNGDVVRAFSAVDSALPMERQNKRVRVEGEVQRPGDYVLPASSSMAVALRTAGGLTGAAFVFGTDFSRESTRRTQQESYERALRDLETDLTRASATQRVSSADEAGAQSARGAADARLLERLRAIKPTGRIVLQLTPESKDLPDLALEDGDRISVPAVPTSVGVFGSVFNASNYLYSGQRTLGEYLQLAGGPTRGADDNSTFVVRANGSVVSERQSSGWLGLGNGKLAGMPAQPGDTIFVPEKLDKTTWTQDVKDWTQILAQFALGAAALKTLGN
jgi:protein involved in polysaccharide export with SLBB domain